MTTNQDKRSGSDLLDYEIYIKEILEEIKNINGVCIFFINFCYFFNCSLFNFNQALLEERVESRADNSELLQILDIKEQKLSYMKQQKNISIKEIQFLRGENKKLVERVAQLNNTCASQEKQIQSVSHVASKERSPMLMFEETKSCLGSMKNFLNKENMKNTAMETSQLHCLQEFKISTGSLTPKQSYLNKGPLESVYENIRD